MNKYVLVTGGLGFIGSHFARLIVDAGYDVAILDKMTYAADLDRIEDIKHKIKLYIGDICDRNLIQDIYYDLGINIIVNFAAETHVDNSIIDSTPFVYSNFVGVQNLLELTRQEDLRFVQISTDETYGSTEYDDQTFKETDRLDPGNPYSATKASADLLVQSYFKTYHTNIAITRSSNNYGPWQHDEKFIPRMISLGIQGDNLEVYGNGNNVRDWLYVEDNVRAIKLVMEKGRTGDIYNIASYDEKTNNEVAKIIADRFGVDINYVEDRKGHDHRYSISCNKIWNELQWEPKVSFEEGIKKTIGFYIIKNHH